MTRNSHRSIRPTPSIPRYTVSSHDIISINLFIFVSFFSAAAGQSKTESPSSSYLSGNTDTSTAILVVVLVCAFLITGCLSLYIRGCSGFDESSFTTITTTGRSLSVIVVPNGDGRSRRGRGLDRSVIDTFPTFLYSEVKESKTGKGTLECAVCLSEFEDEEKLRLLTKCDHVFHIDCIDKWLSAHKTCPVCRANLVPSSEESAEMENTEGNQSESDSNLSEPDTEQGDRGQHCDCLELTRQVRMATVDESQGRQVVQSIDGVKGNNHQVPVIDDNRRYHLRSHSTGHSLIQPRCADDYHERFRLRLPEEVRNQIIISSELKRVASSVALSGDSSSRSEYKRDGDGEDGGVTGGGNRRSAGWLGEWWWVTAAAPSADREGNQVSSSMGILTNVAAPFERAGGKQEPAGSQSQIRPPV